ncbi:YihY/virulence factor BrkB family protein [Nocardioides sp. C4-1]|uniref:YihY/virulence factor BrkB family protein n=1 Tax=Nocardioides sp. C4-1 TaxID=3151851 RepID=UPI003264D884
MTVAALTREARAVVRGTGARLTGRDLSAAAAGLTYFSALSLVPWLLLALWTTSWYHGDDGAERRWLALRVLVPPDMGARPAYDALVHAGTHLGVVGALVVLFPASFYGEGLRRAALAVAPAPDRFTGWRARLTLMPLVVLTPLVGWALLESAELLVPLSPEGGGDGIGDRLLRIVIGFVAAWLVITPILAWVYGAVLPERPRWWVALVGGLATASFVAGFLHGFQLFLAIPVDVGIPYGGLGFVGGAVAVGLWLYVLHTVVLVGWAVTQALESRVAGER